MVPFGEHLRAYEDVRAARVNGVEDFLKSTFAPRAVTIHALDSRIGKTFFERVDDALGTEAEGA